MSVRRIAWGTLAALLILPACGGRYGWIGTAAQAPFRRCICSHPACTAEQHDLAEDYAEASDRRAWLAEHGCDARGFPIRAVIVEDRRAPQARQAELDQRRREIMLREQQAEAERAERRRPRWERNVDEFTGQAEVRFVSGLTIEVRDASNATLGILVHGNGTASFLVHVTFSEWRWLECNHLHLQLNGAPFPLSEPNSNRRGSVHRGYVSEMVGVTLTASELAALVAASTVRFRICRDVVELPADVLEVLREGPPSVSP